MDIYANCTLSDMVKAVERARILGEHTVATILDQYILNRWGAPSITGHIDIKDTSWPQPSD